MDWKIKAAAFRVLSAMPNGSNAHFLLQRHVTKNWPRVPEDIAALAKFAQQAVSDFRSLSSTPIQDAVFLEVGAGRDLTVPIALRMIGVGAVITVDIARLARLDLINHSASVLADILGKPAPNLATWDKLRDFGVDYRAPASIGRDSKFPLIDAFVSNEVLEHIPEPIIEGLIRDVGTHSAPKAVAIHAIDYSDHYARGGGVSRYNFLRFTDDAWKPYNSGFQYVNRLRHSEYIRMFENAGFQVAKCEPYSETIPDEIASELADQFKKFAIDDLSIMRSRIVAQKI